METDPAFHEVAGLWLLCRSGMGGLQHLPGRGAVLDQGAWIMDAFQICAAAAAWLDREMPLRAER